MDNIKLDALAKTGDEYLEGEIKGVILWFHGLGGGNFDAWQNYQIEWAKKGYLLVWPLYGPWSWYNRASRALVDEIVDAVYEKYGLDDNIPLYSTGGSMGGFTALAYSRYGKRTPAKCIAFYPVTDMKYHFSERADLPKSMFYAMQGYEGSADEWFYEQSPLCQCENMPKIPYMLIHGDADMSVNKAIHSDAFVKKMRELGADVEYIEISGYPHGGWLPTDIVKKIVDFI